MSIEKIAELVRKNYWEEVGEERGPWEGASEKSKKAWISSVALAIELDNS